MKELKILTGFLLFITIVFFFLTERTDRHYIQTNVFIIRSGEEKEQEKQIKKSLPAENVLLATGYRTGSSFFAELFNQNDDIFYVSQTIF